MQAAAALSSDRAVGATPSAAGRIGLLLVGGKGRNLSRDMQALTRLAAELDVYNVITLIEILALRERLRSEAPKEQPCLPFCGVI